MPQPNRCFATATGQQVEWGYFHYPAIFIAMVIKSMCASLLARLREGGRSYSCDCLAWPILLMPRFTIWSQLSCWLSPPIHWLSFDPASEFAAAIPPIESLVALRRIALALHSASKSTFVSCDVQCAGMTMIWPCHKYEGMSLCRKA